MITRGGDRIIEETLINDLDSIPSPYKEGRLTSSENKLIYYESSRGCPFRCSYCMASNSHGVRYFSLDRVKADLNRIVNTGAKIIKFTDRTFNADYRRTEEILNYILETFKDREVCFHLEVGGDLFKESTIRLLQTMPIGLIQMEAGVQTLNTRSLKEIDRVFEVDRFKSNIRRIIEAGNIHMHLDLIAGLPYDDLDSFKYSYNQLIALRPHMLQLGFLKLLKGTRLREEYKVEFTDIAPYEVISTPTMSREDLYELKQVEWITDRLYNSSKFTYTLEYLFKDNNPYEMMKSIALSMEQYNIDKRAQENDIYIGLIRYMGDIVIAKDLLRFDYLLTNNSRVLPKALMIDYSVEFRRFLAQNKPTRYIMYEELNYLPSMVESGRYIVRFDYSNRNPVNGQYNYTVIDRLK